MAGRLVRTVVFNVSSCGRLRRPFTAAANNPIAVYIGLLPTGFTDVVGRCPQVKGPADNISQDISFLLLNEYTPTLAPIPIAARSNRAGIDSSHVGIDLQNVPSASTAISPSPEVSGRRFLTDKQFRRNPSQEDRPLIMMFAPCSLP